MLGIQSDGLFTFAEQQELAAAMPNARLRTIDSPEGHDAFLLQFEQVNHHILEFFREVLPDIMGGRKRRRRKLMKSEKGEEEKEDGNDGEEEVREEEYEEGDEDEEENGQVGGVLKTSTFGEAEVEDITAW